MKRINFTPIVGTEAASAASSKVETLFVSELRSVFELLPKNVTMRFKQDRSGRLIIALTIKYRTDKVQTLEGFGDADLIAAISAAMVQKYDLLHNYNAEDHDVEVAVDGENLVFEIFSRYINATTHCYIEPDWVSPNGVHYRCVTFSPSYNRQIKFCLKATDEVNHLIIEACKPDYMKKAKLEELLATEETASSNE